MSEILSESNVKQAVPFFRVAHIEESVRFYVDGLGFKVTQKWVVENKLRWCWLQLGDVALMLQEYPKEGRDAWVPQCKSGRRRDDLLPVRRCPGHLPRDHPAGPAGLAALCGQWDVGDIGSRPGWLPARI